MRILVFLFLLAGFDLPAQTRTDSTGTFIPEITFKTNLTTLINVFKEAFELSSDMRLAPRISMDVGAGVYFNSIVFASNKGESYEGLRLRAGFKYYFLPSTDNAFYGGLMGSYNDIRQVRIRQVYRQGFQYIQYLQVDRRIVTRGVALRMGWPVYSGKHKRLMVDPYVGVGVLFNRVTRTMPPDATPLSNREFFSFEFPDGDSKFLDILIGVHLGIALW
jgi:hypothetical protein